MVRLLGLENLPVPGDLAPREGKKEKNPEILAGLGARGLLCIAESNLQTTSGPATPGAKIKPEVGDPIRTHVCFIVIRWGGLSAAFAFSHVYGKKASKKSS